ncbi:TPA: hypothetical protein N0F65_009077 [Lagenidium giganteum]|uniref:Transposase Tc1-like domain-containing protein n=1 Tax=Lagenidium giganteum TaxID=4803 RepID=A0AAV2YPG8_9STRA|nr:TPA: hypothetical protein N0F65_009077 [Lagenidium giganteum]
MPDDRRRPSWPSTKPVSPAGRSQSSSSAPKSLHASCVTPPLQPRQQAKSDHEDAPAPHPKSQQLSSAQLVSDLKLPISARRVRHCLQHCQHLAYTKRMKAPKLTKVHEKWAVEHVTWKSEWDSVIFSDEKKSTARTGRRPSGEF